MHTQKVVCMYVCICYQYFINNYFVTMFANKISQIFGKITRHFARKGGGLFE